MSERDLVELLPLVREYCAFSGVEHTDAQLLAPVGIMGDPDRRDALSVLAAAPGGLSSATFAKRRCARPGYSELETGAR